MITTFAYMVILGNIYATKIYRFCMYDLKDEMNENNPKEWICEICEYTTKRKADYRRHLSSSRHLEKTAPAMALKKRLTCVCGRHYVHMSGLSRHRSSCSYVKDSEGSLKGAQDESANAETSKLLGDLIQQVRDLREIVPTTATSNVTNNNNNYIVNLNLFLNEKCKDALSLDEFVRRIEFVFDDLHDTSWRSKVLLSNLGSLQVENRPFHCLDPTTCQLMMKNGSKWEEGGKEHLEYTLDNCGKRVQAQFGSKWERAFPDWTESETQNRKYMSLWKHITSEPTKEQRDEDVKRISTETTIPEQEIV